jgi:hypothetical protein
MAAAEFERPKVRPSLPVTDHGENVKCTARSVNALRSWVASGPAEGIPAPKSKLARRQA